MKLRYMAGFIVLCAIALFLGWLNRPYSGDPFGPGESLGQTAHILVHDRKFGMRAKEKAIEGGDAILPWIRYESRNFELLDNRNAFWIAEVLGATETDRSRKILIDLYSRTSALARLTGAVGLARHGALPDPIDENSFLVQNVRTFLSQNARMDPHQTETWLSIIALGWTGDEKALPCLFDLLEKRPIDYWHHAHACEALARIRSKEAIPVLRDCLKSEQFYALPSAFRTLITLGDREAVPLAIARVTPEIQGSNSGFIVGELEKVTGQSCGDDPAQWEKWWSSVQETWQIPDEFTKPWDEQERMY